MTTRPTLIEALAAMHGKEIGVLLRPDGSARLQWPDQDDQLPNEMTRMRITDAHIFDTEAVFVGVDLIDEEKFLTFRFAVADIGTPV